MDAGFRVVLETKCKIVKSCTPAPAPGHLTCPLVRMEHTDALIFLREHAKRLRAATHQMELATLARSRSGRIDDRSADRAVVQELRELARLTMQAYLAEAEARTQAALKLGAAP